MADAFIVYKLCFYKLAQNKKISLYHKKFKFHRIDLKPQINMKKLNQFKIEHEKHICLLSDDFCAIWNYSLAR